MEAGHQLVMEEPVENISRADSERLTKKFDAIMGKQVSFKELSLERKTNYSRLQTISSSWICILCQ